MRQKIVAHFGVTVCRKSLKNEPLGKIDMKILKVAVALGLATSLSGCLSDDNTDVDVVSMASTLLEQRDGASTIDYSDLDTLPSTATMTGVIGARFSGSGPKAADGEIPATTGLGIAGQMSMEADFGAETVTGSTSNLGLYEYSTDCPSGPSCVTTRLSSLDGDLTLDGSIGDSNSDGSGRAIFFGSLNGVVNGELSEGENDYTYTALVDMGVNGQFLKDTDDVLMAEGALSGAVAAVYEDQDGNQDTLFSEDLEGYMIVEGEVVADVPE
jgi:hypothetical protein